MTHQQPADILSADTPTAGSSPIAEDHSQRNDIRLRRPVAAAVVVGALVIGGAIGTTATWLSGAGGKSGPSTTTAADQKPVLDTIAAYTAAVNAGDVNQLKALSCGNYLNLLNNPASAAAITASEKKATGQHGPGQASQFQNVSVDGDQATVIARITYGTSQSTQIVQPYVYGLTRSGNRWQVCWSNSIK